MFWRKTFIQIHQQNRKLFCNIDFYSIYMISLTLSLIIAAKTTFIWLYDILPPRVSLIWWRVTKPCSINRATLSISHCQCSVHWLTSWLKSSELRHSRHQLYRLQLLVFLHTGLLRLTLLWSNFSQTFWLLGSFLNALFTPYSAFKLLFCYVK